MKNKPKTNLVGQKFGKLTVISFEGFKVFWKNRRESNWKVQCECGKEKILRIGILKQSKSCGCLLKEFRTNILPKLTAKRNSKPNGEASKNTCYKSYINRAKKKNIPFVFNKEEFLSLTQQNCFYCGRKPNNIIGDSIPRKATKPRKRNGIFIYNGIDRIDSSKGYTKDNCVTCCEICNKAKRNMDQKDFLNWINDLIEFRSKNAE